ncbi:MAG: PTS sugar transporter subunit IIC [Desulfomonilaceae bacterium]
MLQEAFLAGPIGSLLWLDRYQIGQLMISRPIVVGSILGGVLGDITTGLSVGVLFEVLWLRRPPIGGFIAPDVTFASAISASIAIIVHGQHHFDVLALALLSFMLCMPLAFLGSKLDLVVRLCLGKMAIPAGEALAQRDSPKLAIFFISSLITGFVICLLTQVPIIIVGSVVLNHIVKIWPQNLLEALKFAYLAVPTLGALDMLAGNLDKSSLIYFVIGLVGTISFHIFF